MRTRKGRVAGLIAITLVAPYSTSHPSRRHPAPARPARPAPVVVVPVPIVVFDPHVEAQAASRAAVIATVPTTTSTTVTTSASAPPEAAARSGAAAGPHPDGGTPGMSWLLRAIGGCESSGRRDGPLLWTKWNTGGSGANGAFQDVGASWRTWESRWGAGHYWQASDAPPAEQIRVNAAELEHDGTGAWSASRSCWG